MRARKIARRKRFGEDEEPLEELETSSLMSADNAVGMIKEVNGKGKEKELEETEEERTERKTGGGGGGADEASCIVGFLSDPVVCGENSWGEEKARCSGGASAEQEGANGKRTRCHRLRNHCGCQCCI